MGWETNVLSNISFCKETYNNLHEVEIAITDTEKSINKIKQLIHIMTTSRPEDLLLNTEDNLFSLSNQVEELINDLEEYNVQLYKLKQLKDNYSTVDGDFIENPNRKKNVREWLVNNFVLDKEDLKEENE